ncbi:hypothetical protein SAMD00023353_0100250 [Rosellinia necatrix]|uniref:J domain-containing protein n=1 Tax=Rosellinia necatrix TaxID=77044 RepID=A0A1S8A4L2_ROSNE|nr:hypothetical protein SAMD00023353_0100250 [Rosellinia necatrix]
MFSDIASRLRTAANKARPTYYALLNVSLDVTDADLRRAYRRAAGAQHPDRFQRRPAAARARAAGRFAELRRAYEFLLRGDARCDYDRAFMGPSVEQRLRCLERHFALQVRKYEERRRRGGRRGKKREEEEEEEDDDDDEEWRERERERAGADDDEDGGMPSREGGAADLILYSLGAVRGFVAARFKGFSDFFVAAYYRLALLGIKMPTMFYS